MIKCRNCGAVMEKTYSFASKEGTECFRCPECGASTAAKPIAYGDDGYLPQRRRKKKNDDRDAPDTTERRRDAK